MIRRLVLAVALVPMVLLAACDWAQPGYGPARTGSNPHETRLGPANVAQLTEVWSAPLPEGTSAPQGPLVARGRVFVTADAATGGPSVLTAYDADDGTQLWSRSVPGIPEVPDFSPDLRITTAGDVVVLTAAFSSDFGGLEALDAATGEVLWSTPARLAAGEPVVQRGVVYAWYLSLDTYRGGLAAFDLETGEVLWRSPDVSQQPLHASAQGGRLYATVGEEMQVFDAAGIENCTGEPTICQPVWTATVPGGGSYRPPVLAAGTAFVLAQDTVMAFPADGCGSPTCQPVWTAAGAPWPAGAAVADGTLFVPHGGAIAAYPAAGCGATTCAARWTAPDATGTPAVANGVVYASGGDRLHAFAAAGCGAATCPALWSSEPGTPADRQPAITGGRVYVAGTSVRAFALPAA
jgi:outer membrane protein assembly factor BamB